MDVPTEPVRDAGRNAVHRLRLDLAHRIADLLQRDPGRLDQAVEVGLIRREWLERPGEEPLSTSTPVEVVERMLERQIEKRPSLLPALGLTAIQVLSAGSSEDGAEGVPTRLAVAFTDLEGFTRYTAASGDEAASQLLADHHRTMGPIVRSRGGRIVKRLGDGLLLTFNAPEAAVLACLELVGHPPAPLRVRAGVHIGDIVVSMDDVIGHVVNVAARVAESAKGGEVLATGDVKDAIGVARGYTFGPARRRTFKGLGESVRVSRVRMLDDK
jgi:adenylate cyclase